MLTWHARARAQEGDSAGTKFRGSLLNALVFVAAITVMTFVIVLLFKYGVRPTPGPRRHACTNPPAAGPA